MQRTVSDRRRQAMQLEERMRDPQRQVDALRERTRIALARLHSAFQSKNEGARARFEDLAATLNSLSPLAVLGRGYSLTRTIPENAVVRDAATLRPGENVRLTFAQGEARARIEEVTS